MNGFVNILLLLFRARCPIFESRKTLKVDLGLDRRETAEAAAEVILQRPSDLEDLQIETVVQVALDHDLTIPVAKISDQQVINHLKI